MPKFNTAYDRVIPEGLENTEPSMTKQSFKEECDIHNILEKYASTGVLTVVEAKPQYGNFASAPEYMEAQNLIAKSREMFEALPARLRERFANDPANMLAFVDDPENKAEAEALGLIEKMVDVQPILVDVKSDTVSPAQA